MGPVASLDLRESKNCKTNSRIFLKFLMLRESELDFFFCSQGNDPTEFRLSIDWLGR